MFTGAARGFEVGPLRLMSQSWGTAKNAVFLANYGYFSPWDNYCKSDIPSHYLCKMRSLHHERGCKNGSYRFRCECLGVYLFLCSEKLGQG